MKTAVSANPITTIIVGLVSIVTAFYSKSPLTPTPTTVSVPSVPVVSPAIVPFSITRFAKLAGFAGADLLTAVEIAYAESGGSPVAIGDNGESFGLWQINIIAHPEYTGSSLLDPQANANAAFKVYTQDGKTFNPWTTFNNGAYKNQLAKAEADAVLATA